MEKEKSLYAIVIILAVALVVVAVVKVSLPQQGEHTITVSGTASKNVEPNQATISFSIETKADNGADAQTENAGITEKARGALKDSGVENKDIETVYFNVGPEYRYNPATGESTLTGYKATHTVSAKVRSIQDAGAVLDRITKAGATSINYVEFGLDDARLLDVKNGLISEATANAREKADAMAAASGTKIKGIGAITENSFDYPPIKYSNEKASAMMAAGDTGLSPGEIKVSITIGASYLV